MQLESKGICRATALYILHTFCTTSISLQNISDMFCDSAIVDLPYECIHVGNCFFYTSVYILYIKMGYTFVNLVD